jgi:hypothetical protein
LALSEKVGRDHRHASVEHKAALAVLIDDVEFATFAALEERGDCGA